MVFNYDKATGKVGSNKNNLENALTEVKDFFLKKQDIEKPYTLSKDEYSFFERMKKELSDSQLNGSAEDSKDAMLQLAEEITGADSSLVKYIQDTDVASVSQVGFAQSQKTVIQGTTKFSAVMKTAGGVAKSFVATLGSMAVAAAAAWAIGKVIEGIDYLYHYDENIIKAGQEAKDSIDSTFKSFEEGKQSIMDLGSSFGDQTEQIKNTGDAIDQVAEKYVKLRKGVNQNTNENVSLSTDEYVPSGAKFTDTNTWRPLGTAANTACAGNDSRLSNSRPASDVYSWAKASSKPSYSWSEITSKPSTFTPASHTHAYIPLSGGTITGSIIRSSGGSWISARNNVAVRGTATGKDSWNPVVGQATPNGYWTIGNLASNDNLAFSYTSNTNYNAGNNSATTVYLPVQEGTIITSATIGSQSVKYATSAGSAGSVAWGNVSGKPSSYTPSSHTHDDRYYTETEINTKLGSKLGAVSANGYYGMTRPDGNTSDWIRTTTVGIIPYQAGGAGSGHCGLGTSSWYFSSAYIDTVNCVNASVSGRIDVGGYIQSSNLINTYFEYQSNRGSVDWRFGAATGTGDENLFGLRALL